MFTIAQFKATLAGKIRGANLDKVRDIYAVFGEASRTMLARLDPETTIRRHHIANAIYDKVYNYTAPTDLKSATKIIDLRPLSIRSTSDEIGGRFLREFDIKKEHDTLTVEYIDGVPTLRLSKNLTPHTVLDTLDSLTTITGSGDVTDLTTDRLNYVSGTSSIRFNLSGATGLGHITITPAQPIDLTDLENIGALFHWLRFPNASNLVSAKLSFGTDASNCWHRTVTTAYDRVFTSNVFQLLSYLWNGATKVGAPDASSITWIHITLTYTGAQTAVYLDNITASIGEAYELLYYSSCPFTDTTGTTWKEIPTADTDIIMLDSTAINILIYETKIILADEIKGAKMGRDVELARIQLDGTSRAPGLYDLYELEHPSQAMEHQSTYYEFDDLNE